MAHLACRAVIALGVMLAALVAALVVWRRTPRSPAVGALLLTATLAPLAAVLLASALGTVFGCTVNEAGTTPCAVGGWDAGPLLTDLFVSGWLMVFTLVPLGGLTLAWFLTGRSRRPS